MLLFNAQIFYYKHIWCLPFCMHAFNILRNTLELAEAQNWQREPNTYRSVNVPSEKAFGNTGHVRCVCIHDECVRAWVRNIFITVRRLCTVAVIELDHFHSFLFSSHFITYTSFEFQKRTHCQRMSEWVRSTTTHYVAPFGSVSKMVNELAIAHSFRHPLWAAENTYIDRSVEALAASHFLCLFLSLSVYLRVCVSQNIQTHLILDLTSHPRTHTPKPFTLIKQTNSTHTQFTHENRTIVAKRKKSPNATSVFPLVDSFFPIASIQLSYHSFWLLHSMKIVCISLSLSASLSVLSAHISMTVKVTRRVHL